MDEEEAFRGGLLSPGPSASAPSVKNDDISCPSETNQEGEPEEYQEADALTKQSEGHHHPQSVPANKIPKKSLQPKRESISQADIMTPRSRDPIPKRTSSQTPFRAPPSTAAMKTARTPSSRSVVSARSMASSSSSTPMVSVPVKVHILALDDRDKHPYHNVEPKYTCTLKLMSNTKTKEVCLHAADYLRRKFDIILDGSRFEVRDKEGCLFSRGEMISEEVLDGDALYLIEDAVSGIGKETELDDLPRLQASERSARKRNGSVTAYRTPSLSSRTSSSVKKWTRGAKSQPGKATTAAQKTLELTQTQSVPRPTSPGKMNGGEVQPPEISEEPLHSSTSATPAKDSAVVPFAASTTPRKKWTVRREPSVEQQETDKEALAEAVASQQSLPSPESSPAPQDNTELVIPDSQEDPPSPSPSLSPKKAPVQCQLPQLRMSSKSKSKPNSAPQPPETRPRSAPPTKTGDISILANSSVVPPKSLPSRPDPYDISTVLSDDENFSSRPQKTVMSSFARRLGSSSKRAPAAAPSSARQPAPSSTRPSSPTEDESFTMIDQTVIASTPAKPAPTPKRANVSSPAAPLPSSPTNHIAAVVAKDRARASHPPQGEAVMVDDSSDDVDESLLQEAPQRFSSSNQALPSEPSAHWTGPPKLDLSQALDPFWAVRSVGRRRPERDDEENEDTKRQIRRLGEIGGSHATRIGSGQSKPQAQSSGSMPSSKTSIPGARFPKEQPTVLADSPSGFPSETRVKKTTNPIVSTSSIIEVHGSSSETSDNGNDETASKESFARQQESLPSKNTEAIVISDTSSQYGSEEESTNVRNEAGLVPVQKTLSPPEQPPLPNNAPIDDFAALPDSDEPQLPVLRKERTPLSTALGRLSPSQSKAATLVEMPKTDPFVEPRSEESPPSAQPSKRKRESSEEPDSEEEDRKKKARRDERRARQRQRRIDKKEREKKELARLEQERKELAAEQARLRAQRLEIIVSSPFKAANLSSEASVGSEEASDTGYDRSPSTPEPPSMAEPAVFEEGDNNDSLSSRETEGRSSWRKLSKRHFSESPKCNQKHDRQVEEATHVSRPSTIPTKTAVQDSQSEKEGKLTVERRYQREVYDDWAFLEAHLSKGHAVVDVHNRLHMRMMHEGIQHAIAARRAEVVEPTAEKTPKAISRAGNEAKKDQKVLQRRNTQDQAGDAGGTRHSNRSAVPSLKGVSAARATASGKSMVARTGDEHDQAGVEEQKTGQKKRNKNPARKEMCKSRNKQWKRSKNASFKQIRRALVQK